MKKLKFSAHFILGMILVASCASANPVDLSVPGGELGAANPKGYLEIWREIDGVGLQLGKGSYLPLRYKFSSDPTIGGILGPGFYLPMFEARNSLIRERTMRAYLPCGKGLYLWRDTIDPNKFNTPDKEWTGYLNGDDFIVWRDDGWKVLYHKSRLASITSDDNHVFNWAYDNGGASVSEDAQSILTMETNLAGQVAAFVFAGKRYEVGYAERPITQILQGQVAIKELDQALSRFKYPDGTMDVFKFALTPERVPTLTFTDTDKHQTIYTWAPNNYCLTTEKGPGGNWTYQVGGITQDFGLPPLSRSSSDGKTESAAIDNKMGTYMSTGADGIATVTHVFETPGPLYHKVKSIDKTTNGVTTTIYKASYDETGNLIRKIDENNIVTTFKYDAAGNQLIDKVSLSTDPAVLLSLAKQEKVLLERLQNAPPSGYVRLGVLNDLVIFYTCKALDFDKAKALEKLMTDPDEIYNLKLILAVSNPSHTAEQRNSMLADLVKEYPDKKAYTENLEIK